MFSLIAPPGRSAFGPRSQPGLSARTRAWPKISLRDRRSARLGADFVRRFRGRRSVFARSDADSVACTALSPGEV